MSKLSLFCDKIIEASWLAAIILAPLFFDVYSSRVFEPDKISLVRSLALIMLAAWFTMQAEKAGAARRLQERGHENTSLADRARSLFSGWSKGNPLTLPTLLLVGIYIVSTVASLSPSVSFLGSYQRLQGLYTTLSYIVIFLLAASSIRSKAQIDRAISVALVVSFPIAFYGIIQHYFLDPLPWGGDVTSRVASNMGNAIFVGAYLIMVIPLALGRLIEHARRAADSLSFAFGRKNLSVPPLGEDGRKTVLLYAGIVLSYAIIVAAWFLSFELGAKKLIDAGFGGTLTPEMLNASASNFSFALGVTLFIVFVWWGAAFALKRTTSTFLLIGVYTVMLAIQSVTVLFTQSRGPLLGILGAMFTFAVLYALVRGARRVALGAMVGAVALLAFLAMFNLAQAAPFAALRDLPYIGRLGRVFDTEGGTGEVRVLIWGGALKLALPHAPLEWPTGGSDRLNPLRPLIGYGPETMYVAYNEFYPPDLAHLESRNATPDRSHNETFDALVTTGLVGFIAENLLFLSILYYALKWLGFIQTVRQRNAFVALWYLVGLGAAVTLGAIMGWQFIGVALPAGMILGFFIYLVGAAILRGSPARQPLDPSSALLLVTLLATIVGHFIEIHFGIAIVSTRTYFWFVVAMLVVVGTGRIGELVLPAAVLSQPIDAEEQWSPQPAGGRRRSRRSERQPQSLSRSGRSIQASRSQEGRSAAAIRETRTNGRSNEISTAPLIAFAFITGLIMATMGFDYITINSVGNSAPPIDTVIVALTSKSTTVGPLPSYAMLWLFVGTLMIALAIALAEWGRTVTLQPSEWLLAGALFFALSAAVFSTFIFFHVYLIATPGPGAFDATLSAFTLFVVFVLVLVAVVAITLLFDYRLPSAFAARATSWIVAPVLAAIALFFILVPNVSVSAVSVVQSDIIYKDALGLANGSTLAQSIQRFQQALDRQPDQDYYLLFLGRSYLEYAKTLQGAGQREQALNQAEQALLRARDINPLQTDHTANLARLYEAWATMEGDVTARTTQYEKALDYYSVAVRMSPNTVHLYDQYAQAELEYAAFLKTQNQAEKAAEATLVARDQLAKSLEKDPTFCLSYAVRAQTQNDWTAEVRDSLDALKYAPGCGEVFDQDGRQGALQALMEAGDRASAAGASAQYESMLETEGAVNPSVELFTALANAYSTRGAIQQAVVATDKAVALISASDTTSRQRYGDFRNGLVALQQAISATKASPNDAETHRTLAKAWVARGQPQFALPEYQQVAALLPTDYDSHRMVALLLVQRNDLVAASSAITPTMTLAPEKDRPFWDQLAAVLTAALRGQNQTALADLKSLMKSVDPQDSVTLQALKDLSTKLGGAG